MAINDLLPDSAQCFAFRARPGPCECSSSGGEVQKALKGQARQVIVQPSSTISTQTQSSVT